MEYFYIYSISVLNGVWNDLGLARWMMMHHLLLCTVLEKYGSITYLNKTTIVLWCNLPFLFKYCAVVVNLLFTRCTLKDQVPIGFICFLITLYICARKISWCQFFCNNFFFYKLNIVFFISYTEIGELPTIILLTTGLTGTLWLWIKYLFLNRGLF